MEEVCNFIKAFIKDNKSQNISFIPVNDDDSESFQTNEEEIAYIIEWLYSIDDIELIDNIEYGEHDDIIADLTTFDELKIKISVGITSDSMSYDYWAVEVEKM